MRRILVVLDVGLECEEESVSLEAIAEDLREELEMWVPQLNVPIPGFRPREWPTVRVTRVACSRFSEQS